MSRSVLVLDPGPLTTVQDRGRPGLAAMGVSRSGAADLAAHDLANRLVGNDAAAATLEITMGGLVLRAEADLVIAVAGARCPGVDHHAVVGLRAGAELRLGTPRAGLRSYLAVRGGWAVPAVLGSRSTDLLSGLGPDPLRAGHRLLVGHPPARPPVVDQAPVPEPPDGAVLLGLVPGPRDAWFAADALELLQHVEWTVHTDSNRVGIRLDGPVGLTRTRPGELVSEGIVRGAVQVPPSGKPLVFLADHPVTGGYPVIGCVREDDLAAVAQLRPGQGVWFHLERPPTS